MATVELIRDREAHASGVRELLEAVDEEFVPPLTDESRSGISRTEGEGGRTDVDGYVRRCLDRPLVGVVDDDLLGFLSFARLRGGSAIEAYTPTNHVEILAVDPERRGEGIATRMYRYLLDDLPESHRAPYVSTKTWAENDAHIRILERLGFDLVHRVPDDRGPGIDTVYYARSVDS